MSGKFLGLGSINGERGVAEVGRDLALIQLLHGFLHCAKLHTDLSSAPALIESEMGFWEHHRELSHSLLRDGFSCSV